MRGLLPGSGMESVSPALAGRLHRWPTGEVLQHVFNVYVGVSVLPSLLWLNNRVWLDILCVHLLFDGHFNCFHLWAAVTILVWVAV